jgi:hypothetical protein
VILIAKRCSLDNTRTLITVSISIKSLVRLGSKKVLTVNIGVSMASEGWPDHH